LEGYKQREGLRTTATHSTIIEIFLLAIADFCKW